MRLRYTRSWHEAENAGICSQGLSLQQHTMQCLVLALEWTPSRQIRKLSSKWLMLLVLREGLPSGQAMEQGGQAVWLPDQSIIVQYLMLPHCLMVTSGGEGQAARGCNCRGC